MRIFSSESWDWSEVYNVVASSIGMTSGALRSPIRVDEMQEGIQVNMLQQQQINAVREDIANELWAHHNNR